MPLVSAAAAQSAAAQSVPESSTWRTWLASFFFADASGMRATADASGKQSASTMTPPACLHTDDGDPSPPHTPPSSATDRSAMRRTWSASDGFLVYDLDDCPGSPSAVERLYCEQRLQALNALDDIAQGLIRELFAIITGEDDLAEPDDQTIIEHNPGYEKSDEQRSIDCARVAAILGSSVEGVHANLKWEYGETLLWMAIEYDHAHPPQMIEVLLSAGADPNAANAIDGQVPLQNPWLSDDDEMAAEGPKVRDLIAMKRALLVRAGADERWASGQHTQRRGDPGLTGGRGGRGNQRKRALPGDSEGHALFSRSRSSLW